MLTEQQRSEKLNDTLNALAPENVYVELFDQARQKLGKLEKSKYDVIVDLAEKLEAKGVSKEKISALIAPELKDYVSRRYVSQCLDPDQKRGPRGGFRELVPKTEEEAEIIWQIKPEEYLVQDVDQYDRACLIRIVKYLDTGYTNQKFYVDKVDDLQNKVESLQTENNKLKARVQKLESYGNIKHQLNEANILPGVHKSDVERNEVKH
jgi:hypothetical protein